MEIVKVYDLNIRFPFKPYPIQKSFMTRVVKCLKDESNALLESPTGSGKTLSLLCSTLAWIEASRPKNNAIQSDKDVDLVSGVNLDTSPKNEHSEMSMEMKNSLKNRKRIIYSSRTHIQLAQAVKELKRTDYKNMDAVVLGSRDQLCLHSSVSNMTNEFNKKNDACLRLIRQNKCKYYNGYCSSKKNGFEEERKLTPVMDIEDLRNLGSKHECCPYYASKEIQKRADLVFMPYNYIIDYKMRQAANLHMKNNVIIFDEGHNIERCFEESMSCKLASVSLTTINDECNRFTKLYQKPDNNEKDLTAVNMVKIVNRAELITLNSIVVAVKQEIDKLLEKEDELYLKRPLTIFALLQKCNLDEGNYKSVMKTLEDVISCLSAHTANTSTFRKCFHSFKNFQEFISILFQNSATWMDSRDDVYADKFAVYVQKHYASESGKSGKPLVEIRSWLKGFSANYEWTIHCVCLSPSIAMKSLIDEGVHSIIITSGTLAPLASFPIELGIPFNVKLQSPHIIPPENLKVFILPKGSDNIYLDGTFRNRANPAYYKSLGMAVVDFCERVPGGVLVFFSSYSVMNNCCYHWEHELLNSVWEPLSMAKTIFKESNDADILQSSIQEFKMNVFASKKGAIFMAVCRGKLSEGFDLGNDYCRGVIIAGLPYPNLMDKKVVLKRRYLDARINSHLTSNQWYNLQMKRVVNQAVGRVLRHKNDYGVVLLADERYTREKSSFCNWIQDFIVNISYKETMLEIDKFFTRHGNGKLIIGPSNSNLVTCSPSTSDSLLQLGNYVSTSVDKHSSCGLLQTKCNRLFEECDDENQEVKSKRRKFSTESFNTNVECKSLTTNKVTFDVILKQSEKLQTILGGQETFNLIVALFKRYNSHGRTALLVQQVWKVFQDRKIHKLDECVENLAMALTDEDKEKFLNEWKEKIT